MGFNPFSSSGAIATSINRWLGHEHVPVRAAAPRPADPAGVVNPDDIDPGDLNPDAVNPDEIVDAMLALGRSALLMRPQVAEKLADQHQRAAAQAFEDSMVLIAAGDVAVLGAAEDGDPDLVTEHLIFVDAFFLGRFAVTNAQFRSFVADGGYENDVFWHDAVRESRRGFVNRSGEPGPRYWTRGRCQAGHDRHPVVGVNWFEAAAFARWSGCRLPTDAEWIKAATCPVDVASGHLDQRQWPWGNAIERSRANLWNSGPGATVAVDEFPSGNAPNGVQQLVGNVWEWTATDFGEWDPPHLQLDEGDFKSLRGAAFDTYFDCQTTCQFQSGESLLARKHNIGFRCAVGAADLVRDPSTATGPSPQGAPFGGVRR